MLYCNHCGQNTGTWEDDIYVSCKLCGRIIADSSTFEGTRTIEDVAGVLSIHLNDDAVHRARCLFEADCSVCKPSFRGCLRTRFGAAACLYAALRLHDRPFLLVDLSDRMRVAVSALGVMFVELCGGWAEIGSHVADPSLYIHRFTERLLGRDDDEVSMAALRIVASVEKREWMRDRRLTSRMCAAALYVAAVGGGHKVTEAEVVDAVKACEVSLEKQLVEFGDRKVEECGPCPWLPPSRMVCKHKNAGRAPFACGLCRECYDEFVKLCDGTLRAR